MELSGCSFMNTIVQTKRNKNLYCKFFKRLLDVILSLVGLIILLPVLIIIAILVRYNLGSPVLFKQKRPGKNEEIFTMFKFRTMSLEMGSDGKLLSDSIRLTKFGRFLRSTSLDELPELFNILIGDMSIIGPRPLAIQYLPFYTMSERTRHSVRPGLSGLAQINGRNTATWEERFKYDLEYVNNITFLGDVKIIIQTISKAFRRVDIGERGVDAPIDFDKYRSNKN